MKSFDNAILDRDKFSDSPFIADTSGTSSFINLTEDLRTPLK